MDNTTNPLEVPIIVRALLLGERFDTRSIESGNVLSKTPPVATSIVEGGIAVLFRYGVVLLFGVSCDAADRFLASVQAFVTDPFTLAEQEETRLIIRPGSEQFVDAAGNVVLPDQMIERLQLVADVLAKNLMLSHYETRIGSIFDRIEPLATTLRNQGRTGARSKELLQHIGNVLVMQHRMVGRVETGEKPELLWEHPELERLYMRLADEYELRDRDRALDRKLDVISRTVEMLLELVQTRSSIRVEWYIVLLIVAELLLSVYPILLNR